MSHDSQPPNPSPAPQAPRPTSRAAGATPTGAAGRFDRWSTAGLWVLLSLPALYQIGLFLYTVGARFGYDYDLEWMEGGMLHHAWRIAHGLTIYPKPSVEFIPFLYTPLYPATVALLGSVFGLSYQCARAVSLLGVAVVMVCLAGITYRSVKALSDGPIRPSLWTLGGAAAAAGLGLYASGYPWTYGWYDIARVDSMLMALVIGALYALQVWGPRSRHSQTLGGWFDWRIAVVAAILGVSFFAKQTGVIFVAAGGAILLVANWRAIPSYVAITGAIGLGGTYIYNKATDGWFWDYIFVYHQRHTSDIKRFWGAITRFWHHYPAMLCVVGLAAVALAVFYGVERRLPRTGKNFLYWGWVFFVGAMVSFIGLITQWSVMNAYIPAVLTGGIATAVSIVLLFEIAGQLGPRFQGAFSVVVLGVLAAQLYALRWEPKPYIPSDADEAAGHRLVEHIRQFDGDVFVPYFPWYAHLAGKPMTAHIMNIQDVTHLTPRHCPPPDKQKPGKSCIPLPEGGTTVAHLREKLRHKAWSLIILPSNPKYFGFRHDLTANYRPNQTLPKDEFPQPPTAHKLHGLAIWEPIGPTHRPKNARVIFDFEKPRLHGWKLTGKAWGRGPTSRPLPGQPTPGNFGGRRLMNSYHGGSHSTGTAISPPFAIRGSTLSLLVGGGDKPHVAVELRSLDGKVLRKARGQNSEIMRRVRWDVHQWKGQKVRLALVDHSRRGWGHLLVDEVWEFP